MSSSTKTGRKRQRYTQQLDGKRKSAQYVRAAGHELRVCRRIRDSSTRSDCAGHSHPEGISTGNNRFSMQVRARVRE